MSLPVSFRRQICARFGLPVLLAIIVMATLLLNSGCGGNSPGAPVLKGNTLVTIAFTGTANDQLIQFDLAIQSITLTNKLGKTVTLVSGLQPTEWMHVNGGAEPLVTVSIPQDIYTAAAATIGEADFSCSQLTPLGGLDTSTFSYGQTPQANVTVNLPAPITVTGNTMGLVLNLLVTQSQMYSACYLNGIDPFSITPTFNLAPFASSSLPAGIGFGTVAGLNGQVTSINGAGNAFVVSLPELENPRSISVSSAAGTSYQGISGFSALTVGTFINMDGAIQSDGSVVASRVAVEDVTATSVVTGPLLYVSDAEPAVFMWGRQQQGSLFNGSFVFGANAFSFGNAAFQVSGQVSNLQDLPFIASFTGSNMVPGQNLYIATSSLVSNGGFPYTPLSSVTLISQTIDGTVTGSSNTGNFTVYTVELAPYDLFPVLAVQQGQASLLNNPSEVEVYVDANTRQLNSQPLAAGSTLRFYGLIFNDNGTLRMDCAQINDGVSVTPLPASAASHLEKGVSRVIPSKSLGLRGYINRLITPSQ